MQILWCVRVCAWMYLLHFTHSRLLIQSTAQHPSHRHLCTTIYRESFMRFWNDWLVYEILLKKYMHGTKNKPIGSWKKSNFKPICKEIEKCIYTTHWVIGNQQRTHFKKVYIPSFQNLNQMNKHSFSLKKMFEGKEKKKYFWNKQCYDNVVWRLKLWLEYYLNVHKCGMWGLVDKWLFVFFCIYIHYEWLLFGNYNLNFFFLSCFVFQFYNIVFYIPCKQYNMYHRFYRSHHKLYDVLCLHNFNGTLQMRLNFHLIFKYSWIF